MVVLPPPPPLSPRYPGASTERIPPVPVSYPAAPPSPVIYIPPSLRRVQVTLHATRRTPHGASPSVQAMPAWVVKTRRAPPRHCRNARAYALKTTAMHETSAPPPPLLSRPVLRQYVVCPLAHTFNLPPLLYHVRHPRGCPNCFGNTRTVPPTTPLHSPPPLPPVSPS